MSLQILLGYNTRFLGCIKLLLKVFSFICNKYNTFNKTVITTIFVYKLFNCLFIKFLWLFLDASQKMNFICICSILWHQKGCIKCPKVCKPIYCLNLLHIQIADSALSLLCLQYLQNLSTLSETRQGWKLDTKLCMTSLTDWSVSRKVLKPMVGIFSFSDMISTFVCGL